MLTEERIESLMAELKIPHSLKGRLLFEEALLILAKDPDSLITKEVYYPLSKKYGISKSSAEGRIRRVIEYIQKNRDLSHYGISQEQQDYSNKQFLLELVFSIPDA